MEEKKAKYKIFIIIGGIFIFVCLCMIGIVQWQKGQAWKEQERNRMENKAQERIYAPDKPIIYIYPTEETEISVTVDKPENFGTTYPKYTDGWKVIAKPDGTLTDTKTGRNLYALYWEGNREKNKKLETGFIVKREETANFLEEKLAILGLNEREAEEFIIYWLPKLEEHPYNWIYFETKDEIDEYMALEILPKPDTCIRVMMDWKGLDKAIFVPEQTLEKQERSGYTVVEWGGTEIK